MKTRTLLAVVASVGAVVAGFATTDAIAQNRDIGNPSIGAGKVDKGEFSQRKRDLKKRIWARIAQELNLTEAQIAQIQTIKQEAKLDAKAIIQDENLDKEVKKARLMSLKETTKAQIMNVLTDEQQAKLQEILQRLKDRKVGRVN